MPINAEAIVWDEEPQLTETEQSIAQPIDETQVQWDDAPTLKQTPIAPQQELSMLDRIQAKMKELGKDIGEYTPIGATLKTLAPIAVEASGKELEGGKITEARKMKALSENLEFEFGDLSKAWDASIKGDKEAAKQLQVKKDKINNTVVEALNAQGIEAYYDNGKLLVVDMKDGKEVIKDLDEGMLDNIAASFGAESGEIVGGIGGAMAGATAGFKAGGIDPRKRALGAVVGGAIGGYTGATAGSVIDLMRASIVLNKEMDAVDIAEKATARGVADVAGAVAVGVAGKAIKQAWDPLVGASKRLKTTFLEGDIIGAKNIVKQDYGLTDEGIDQLYEAVKKDVKGFEDLSGDDLLRAKLLAAVQQQPQGRPLITKAISDNAKAAIETSKEIDSRAKEVIKSAAQFSKKPSAIRRSVEAYEKVVGKNYKEVRDLIDEALPSYKSDLDTKDFAPVLKDLNTRVIDPVVKEKLVNLSDALASQKSDTVGDLINIRQQYNKFYGKNIQHFDTKPDKDALKSIQDTIDAKIDEALFTLPDEILKPLDTAFTEAKSKYSQMFKTQDTATYNAIFKKGASEKEIGDALVRYSKSVDNDLERVLGKLSPTQRTRAEFSIISKMLDDATAKGEAKAIDFTKLMESVGTSKQSFKTPEAKQFLKNIETFDKKFAKDVDIQRIAAGAVAPKVEKNIATSMTGKVLMKISALRFEAIQRLLPTETGRRLSLQKSLESALENSRTSKEFFFKASKIKGMPNKDRKALKKAVKEIGEEAEKVQAQAQKETLKKQTEAKAKADLKEATKQADIERTVDEKKAKWEWAKSQAKKKKLNEQANRVQDAAEIPIGGSEDIQKAEVKKQFKKKLDPDRDIKNMTKEDIAELDAQALKEEANRVFAKGGTELAGGAIAGLEIDEEGNVSLDPAKFVMGALGVASIKGLAKSYKSSPKAKAKIEKALKGLASDSTRVAGEMLEKINKQIGLNIEPKIIESSKYSVTKASPEKSYNPLKRTIKLDKDSVIVGTQKEDKSIYVGRTKNGEYFTIKESEANKLINKVIENTDKKYSEAFTKHLKELGHDGVIDNVSGKNSQIIAFDANQIKIIPKNEKDLIVQHNLTAENILHAEEVGGLAVPSLAITKADTPLTGFGDITLLGHSDLIKPSSDMKVFGADVYSPRYPQINYSMTAKQQRFIDEDLAPYEAITASREYAEKDSLNALYDNVAFRAKFLDEKGVKVKLPKTRVNKKSMDSYKKYYKDIVGLKSFVDSQQLMYSPEFQKAYIQELKDTAPEVLKDMKIGDKLGIDAEKSLKNMAYRRAQDLSRLQEQSKSAGKPDEYAIKTIVRDTINKKKLSGELKSYAMKYLKDVGAKETIWNGTDRMGRNKYIEHTLSNVISKLKKDIRGGENFNYGLGTTRAKLTPEFKTIKRIQAEKDRLVTETEFELVKKEMDDKVDDVADSLKMYYEYDRDAFGYQGEVLHAIAEQDLRGYGFKNVPNHVIEEVAELTTALREMPTEYFEVKVLRALDAGEFRVAVIPNGTSKETIDLLKKKGLKVSKYNPSNKGAREDAIKKAAGRERILFMHPATVGGAITIGVANEISKNKEKRKSNKKMVNYLAQ